MWENSFHAISISSSMMNRGSLNGVNLFYDTGFFGKEADGVEEEEVGAQANGGAVETQESDPGFNKDSKALAIRAKRLPCVIS